MEEGKRSLTKGEYSLCYSSSAIKSEETLEDVERGISSQKIPLEIEVKLKVDKHTISKLKKRFRLSNQNLIWENQKNIIYGNKEGFVRFRKEKGKAILEIKGKRLPGKYNQRSEIGMSISLDFFNKILRLGYKGALFYEKQRISLEYNECTICLDNLNGQYFVEIEGNPDKIEENISYLKLRGFPRIKKSYNELLMGAKK